MEHLHRQTKTERYCLRLLAAWLMAVSLASLLSPLGQIGGGLLTIAVFTIVCGAFLTAMTYVWKQPYADTFMLCAAAMLTATVHAAELTEPHFVLFVILLLALMGWMLLSRNRLPMALPNVSERTAGIVIGVGAVAMFLFLAVFTTLRYLTYYSPNFDFGIFSNMFYHMRSDLTQTVSCERDMLISHFDVHISPIYYLYLPFYALFPSPITLLVLQAAVVAGGVVPLVLLAKKRGIKPFATVLVAAVYLLYPAFIGGCFYDLHENKILPLLILSMVCAYEYRRFGWMYLFAALTLLVKEDAPIYVAVFGLYLLLGRRARKRGLILAAAAIAYFLLATAMLKWFGLGVMSWRYDNLSENGLLGIFLTLFTNPAAVIAECLNAEKLVFFLQMMLPLCFLPFLTKRPGRMLLLIPFVLVNLMTDYAPQHSINFQYTYGSGALLFYAAVLNLADLHERTLSAVLMGAGMASVVMFAAFSWPRTGIATAYYASRETRADIAEVLAQIPEDASVAADTFFVPHLAARELIFEYPSKNETEYIVLDMRLFQGWDRSADEEKLLASGYTCVCRIEHAAALYQKHETGVTP